MVQSARDQKILNPALKNPARGETNNFDFRRKADVYPKGGWYERRAAKPCVETSAAGV